MPYMIYQHPAVQTDLMFPERYWAKIAAACERTHCTYSEEELLDLPTGRYIIMRDVRPVRENRQISGDICGANEVGELIGLFYAMEWDAVTLTPSELGSGPKKFYILTKPRKRAKKNVQKNRTKADPGRQSGNSGEPDDIQQGSPAGGNQPADPGPDGIQLGMFDEENGGILNNDHQ